MTYTIKFVNSRWKLRFKKSRPLTGAAPALYGSCVHSREMRETWQDCDSSDHFILSGSLFLIITGLNKFQRHSMSH